MNSGVNGSTHIASTPSPATSSALRSIEVRIAGCEPGPDHLGRVRVEGEQQAGPAQRPGPRDRGTDQLSGGRGARRRTCRW